MSKRVNVVEWKNGEPHVVGTKEIDDAGDDVPGSFVAGDDVNAPKINSVAELPAAE